MDDRIRHGTANRGERHGLAKLNDAQVSDIRARYVRGQAHTLAAEFNVSATTIRRLARGEGWGHVA